MRLLRSTLFWAFIGLAMVAATVWQYRLQLPLMAREPSATGNGLSESGRNHSFSGKRVIAEARVATYPGAQVTLSAEISGVLEKLTLDENDTVAKDEVMAEIKADDLRAALAEAKARLGEVAAQ